MRRSTTAEHIRDQLEEAIEESSASALDKTVMRELLKRLWLEATRTRERGVRAS